MKLYTDYLGLNSLDGHSSRDQPGRGNFPGSRVLSSLNSLDGHSSSDDGQRAGGVEEGLVSIPLTVIHLATVDGRRCSSARTVSIPLPVIRLATLLWRRVPTNWPTTACLNSLDGHSSRDRFGKFTLSSGI